MASRQTPQASRNLFIATACGLGAFAADGAALDETDLSGNLQEEYVYFDGRRVAMRDSSGSIDYYGEDFLGSSRVMTNASGQLCYDVDFLPYGQEVDYTDTRRRLRKRDSQSSKLCAPPFSRFVTRFFQTNLITRASL
jgi:hypothetical protein